MNAIYDRFIKLVKAKGMKVTDVARSTGIRNSTFTDWKMGRTNPKVDKLQLIAECLDVSLNFLMYGEEPEAPYYLNEDARDVAKFLYDNPEYKALFDASRKVKKEDIDFVRQMIERTTS